MPTVTTNAGLKCCFKLYVYLFYLLKKTLHTYTHCLDKYKAPKSCFCFRVQHTDGWGWLHSWAWCFYGVRTSSFQSPVRGHGNTAVPSSAAVCLLIPLTPLFHASSCTNCFACCAALSLCRPHEKPKWFKQKIQFWHEIIHFKILCYIFFKCKFKKNH